MAEEGTFEILASETLGRLAVSLEDALGHRAEVDFGDGILTLALDGGGQYVVNRHAASRQIWLSSPVSGASHYARRLEDGAWVDTRGGPTLYARLSQELGVPLENA
jgi:frataxin